MRKNTILFSSRAVAFAFLFGTAPARAQSNQTLYADSLQNGWADWSWATVNLANTTPVHGGAKSISVTAGAWSALYLHNNTAFDPSGYTNFSFWINGGSSGGQLLQVQAVLGGSAVDTGIALSPLQKDAWNQINAPLSSLVPPGVSQVDGFWIMDRSGTAQATFYLDDIQLFAGSAPPPATNATVIVTVDAAANRHPISPEVYGVAFASSNEVAELNCTLNRSGGNAETSYNWQLNAHNLGADWYFESYPDSSATPGASADDHVANSKNGGAQPMITIPIIGWMPKLGPSRGILYSYSVAKYGAQTSTDPYLPDAGNGILSSTGLAITNDVRTNANFLTNSAFQSASVQHLISRWGSSTNGGVRYYLMDNEHSIWFSTHQDIHPSGPTMQEIWTNMLDYAGMVKSNDPDALVAGPEEWGWSGYFYSGADQQWSGQHGDYNPAHYPDRQTHGGLDYMPWLLTQFYQRSTNTHQRLLDYFTLHCYPQEDKVGGNDVSTATQLLRNQSTRQFWDTNYVDPSWINSVIMLIPRMKNWVAACYPGTKTGITEYNWGAESYINGATAQADILGIFGREGLDLATRWTTPDPGTPTFKAMKLYRNYDGNKSAFGDTSVAATVPNPDNLSAFAAIRSSDGALTIMVINKILTGSTPVSLNVTNFTAGGVAQAWQLTPANSISRLADVPFSNGALSNSLPAQSITLFVLPAQTTFQLRLGTNAPAGQLELWLDGQAGQRYVVQSSTNLLAWVPFYTNAPASNSFRILIPATNSASLFCRALLSPP